MLSNNLPTMRQSEMGGPEFVEIAEWKKYQHYHGRTAPWVKLHYQLLDDPRFLELDELQQCRYMKLLMVAIRCGNRIKNDPVYLAKILRVSGEVDLTPLIDSGLLLACRKRRASKPLAACYQKSTLDKTRLDQKRIDEKKTETPPAVLELFETSFWNPYPLRKGRKLGKPEALKKWLALSEEDRPKVSTALKHYAASPDIQDGIGIKDPHRWLRNKDGEPWRDWLEPVAAQPSINGKDFTEGVW